MGNIIPLLNKNYVVEGHEREENHPVYNRITGYMSILYGKTKTT